MVELCDCDKRKYCNKQHLQGNTFDTFKKINVKFEDELRLNLVRSYPSKGSAYSEKKNKVFVLLNAYILCKLFIILEIGIKLY